MQRGPALLFSMDASARPSQHLRSLARIVAALAVVGDHLQQVVLVPEGDIQASQVRELLDVAGALSGQQVRMRYTGFDAAVRGGMVPAFLEKIPDTGGALYATYDMQIELGEQELVVPGLAMWAPGVSLTNREELRRLHDNAPDQEHAAHFGSLADNGIYLARAVEEPGDPWSPVLELE